MRKNSLSTPVSNALVLLVLLCAPFVALAQSDEAVTSADLLAQVSDPAESEVLASVDSGFDSEQLEQLVAPIALYSDGLLTQILMASTYPLEIVQANRWISGQPDLAGDALDEALKEQDWDPSVKSLTTFPSVLAQMSDNLDWTQDLGDAFLAQQNELMDTIQIMRNKAYDEGNLETTEQQVVTQNTEKIIIIESPSPEIVYVPTYSPTVVYGPGWGYPSYYYPGWYYPPRPGYGLVAFGVGVAVGGAIWGRPGWGWGRNEVNINVNRQNNFNRNTNINGGDRINVGGGRGDGNAKWQHDASHRKGVNYRDSNVARQNGAKGGSDRVTRDQARGRNTTSTNNRAGAGTQARDRSAASPRTNASPSAANRQAGGGNAISNNSRNPSTANRKQGGGNSISNTSRKPSSSNRSRSGGNSALSGSRSPSTDRRSSSRGAASRGSKSYGGSRGGNRGSGGRRR